MLHSLLVSKWFMDNRGGSKAGSGYHDTSSKMFCRTVPKNFVGDSVSVSIISALEKS